MKFSAVRSLISASILFLGLSFGGGVNLGSAYAQTWQNVPAQSGSTGTWQALSCNTTSNLTWQPLGCNPVTYSCPNGYVLSGQACSITILSAAIPVYGCSSGTLSGSSCITNTSYAATANWYCPSGGSLSGTTCTVSGSYSAVSGCPSSANLISGKCLCLASEYNGYDEVQVNICPSGASALLQEGMVAPGRYEVVYAVYAPVATCPSGGTLSGSTCYTTSTYAASISSYSCNSGGTLSGSSCLILSTTAASVTSYYCSSGTLSGSQCSAVVTIPATAN